MIIINFIITSKCAFSCSSCVNIILLSHHKVTYTRNRCGSETITARTEDITSLGFVGLSTPRKYRNQRFNCKFISKDVAVVRALVSRQCRRSGRGYDLGPADAHVDWVCLLFVLVVVARFLSPVGSPVVLPSEKQHVFYNIIRSGNSRRMLTPWILIFPFGFGFFFHSYRKRISS